ncbi:hypothetical protein HGRIS_002857 [Hohenbuehelia grisea]|uniref:Uncharacterized protein n=1 Tax=Hohenbuehelia grisea TaxID=104357 RepID=A0ABR3JMI7_9AGAR
MSTPAASQSSPPATTPATTPGPSATPAATAAPPNGNTMTLLQMLTTALSKQRNGETLSLEKVIEMLNSHMPIFHDLVKSGKLEPQHIAQASRTSHAYFLYMDITADPRESPSHMSMTLNMTRDACFVFCSSPMSLVCLSFDKR